NAEYITAVNPKYAFQIKRTLGSSEWVIDQVEIGGDGSRLPLGLGLPQRQTAQLSVCDHFRIWDQHLTLERLFDRPNFKATKIEPLVSDGANLLRIDFECPYP